MLAARPHAHLAALALSTWLMPERASGTARRAGRRAADGRGPTYGSFVSARDLGIGLERSSLRRTARALRQWLIFGTALQRSSSTAMGLRGVFTRFASPTSDAALIDEWKPSSPQRTPSSSVCWRSPCADWKRAPALGPVADLAGFRLALLQVRHQAMLVDPRGCMLLPQDLPAGERKRRLRALSDGLQQAELCSLSLPGRSCRSSRPTMSPIRGS